MTNSKIIPWLNVGHVGAGSSAIPHCATPLWFMRVFPKLFERPRFLPSNNLVGALAQLELLLLLGLGFFLGFALTLVDILRSPLGGLSWPP